MFLFLALLVQNGQAAKKASLQIVGDKPGACIYLNGKRIAFLGDDGFANIHVEEGNYSLYVEKPIADSLMGYSATEEVNISGSMRVDLHLSYGFSKLGRKRWENDRQGVVDEALLQIEMISIPAGQFSMGNDSKGNEQPRHKVKISPFKIAKYETTFELYDLFVLDTGYDLPVNNGWTRGQHPVINVSWDDSQQFIAWLNKIAKPAKLYRLPTEAEWEYAARAGTDTRYWWGNELGHNNANCDGCGSLWDDESTAPVGSFNENPFGLMDTAGNVYEWVEDCWHASYHGAPADGSAWLRDNCKRRVLRGGTWSYFPKYMRSTARDYSYSDYRSSNDGFRLAQDE